MKYRKWPLRFLYFLLGVQTSIYDFTLKRDFADYNVPITGIVLRMFLIMCMWQIKFIPALFCDLYGFGGYHRRPYIIFSNFFCALMAAILSAPNISEPGYITLLFLFNFFICIADVNYDACIIEDGRNEENDKKGKLQIQMWSFRYLGTMIGEMGGPLLWEAIKSEGVYGVLSALCIVAILLGVILKDRPRRSYILNTRESISNTTLDYSNKEEITPVSLTEQGQPKYEEKIQIADIKYLWTLVMLTLTNPTLKQLLLFNLIISLMPNAGFALFYYLTDELKFNTTQMAWLGFIAGAGRLIGINIYSLFNQNNIRCVYSVVGILSIFVTIFPILLAIRVPVNYTLNEMSFFRNVSSWDPIQIGNNTQFFNNNTNEYILQNDTVPLSDLFGFDRFWCALSDDTLGQIFDEIRNMPLLTIASITCKALVEASAYSTLLSLLNATSGLRRLVDSAFTGILNIDHGKFENLWILILICSIAEIISVVLALVFVPSITLKDVAEEIKEREDIAKETLELDVTNRNLNDELSKELENGEVKII